MATTRTGLPASFDHDDAWRKQRRTYLGSSEVYELLNLPQYGKGCVRALAYGKLGVEPDYPVEVDDALLERGDIMEPIAAGIYEQLTGRKVRRPPMDRDGRHAMVRRHPKYEWAAAATDRLILSGHGGVGEVGDLEIKSRGEGAYYRVLRRGPYDGDLLQPQWSMWITGHSWGALAMLGVFGSLPLVHYDVQRDRELQEIFVHKGSEFADAVFGAGKLPDPPFPSSDQRCRVCAYRMTCRGEEIDREEAAALREIKQSAKDLVQIKDPMLATTLSDIELLKRERKAIDNALELAQEKALERLGETDAGLVYGFGKIYRLENQFSGLDSKRLKSEAPEVYEKYFVSRKTGGFHLRLYPAKF